MKTALRIATRESEDGDAGIYVLSEPYGGTEYVVVSALPWLPDTEEPETMVFACDAQGDVLTDYYKHHLTVVSNSMDHARALAQIGYEIVTVQ